MRTLRHLRDRLGFTPGEVRAVLLLSTTLVAGHAVRSIEGLMPRNIPSDQEATFDYRALDSIFQARSDARRSEAPGARPHTKRATAVPQPVDINSADADMLATLPGIGPVYAARIVAYRTAHGPFRSAEDLLEVPGIGRKRLEALKGLLVLR